MNWLENFLINPWHLILSLFLIILMGWLCIIICEKLGRPIKIEYWRKMDCIFLILASLGIFGILAVNREFFCEREMDKISHRINTHEWRINYELDTVIYNLTFNAIVYAQEEIDLIEQDYKMMHLWIRDNKGGIIQSIQKKQYIDTLSLTFPVFKAGHKVLLQKDIEKFKHLFSEYNATLTEYNYYKDQKNQTYLEFLYQILTPLFLVFSLAYQFLRKIWEIGIEKRLRKR